MPRSRTQKQVAKRIDLSYFKKPNALRRARRALIALCLIAPLAWLGATSLRVKNGKVSLLDTIHNPGHVARAHAMFENDCRACHTGNGDDGKFTLTVTDAACLKCHDGALHDANQKLAADE